MMQAVMLAAGLGTRLRPVTATRSKAMAPVVGRPLVERALAPIVACGIRNVLMVVGPHDDGIRRHFKHRSDLGISIEWINQKQRLGMAHALGLASRLITGPFLVSACDSLVGAAHIRDLLAAAGNADVVLSLLDVAPELVPRSAAVELAGERVRRIVEKPRFEEAPSSTISLPLYVFPQHVLPLLSGLERSSRGEFELQDAIQRLIDAGDRVIGVRAAERFQVSTPDDLLKLNRQILRREHADPAGTTPHVGAGSRVIPPVLLDPDVSVGSESVIGPEVYLESGCRVGNRAVVRGAVVLRGARIGDGEEVIDAIVA